MQFMLLFLSVSYHRFSLFMMSCVVFLKSVDEHYVSVNITLFYIDSFVFIDYYEFVFIVRIGNVFIFCMLLCRLPVPILIWSFVSSGQENLFVLVGIYLIVFSIILFDMDFTKESISVFLYPLLDPIYLIMNVLDTWKDFAVQLAILGYSLTCVYHGYETCLFWTL